MLAPGLFELVNGRTCEGLCLFVIDSPYPAMRDGDYRIPDADPDAVYISQSGRCAKSE